MPRLDRLTSMLIQLQSKRIVKAQELADRFQISLRTVYRDMRALEEAGVPILSEAGVGYSLMKEFNLPPIHFSDEETLAFLTAEKLVEKLTDEQTKQAYQAALFKIKSILGQNEKEKLDIINSKITVLKNAYLPDTPPTDVTIQQLLQAMHAKRILEISYTKANSMESVHREVEPVGIYAQGAAWYLIAFCKLREDYRNFRVDRIQTLQIKSEKFHKHHPSLASFLEQTTKEKELTKVIIRVDKTAMPYLGNQHYYMGYVSMKSVAEQMEIEFLSSSLTGFAHWFLYLGSSADIIEPLLLKSIVKEKLEEIKTRLQP